MKGIRASMVMSEKSVGQRGNKKDRVGCVLSDRMSKTLVVECQQQFRHPKYRKVVRTFKKFYVHDEAGAAKKGDVVRIVETRPYSKLKRWRLVEVVQKVDQSKLEVSDVV